MLLVSNIPLGTQKDAEEAEVAEYPSLSAKLYVVEIKLLNKVI